MPHIAMVIPSLAGGGAERTVLSLAGGMVARGHNVDLVLFMPRLAYSGQVPAAARFLVLCGRRKWTRRKPTEMPAGAEWRSERALWHGVRLAAGLFWDTPVLLRRRALDRGLYLSRYVRREKPDILFANLPLAEYSAFYAARLAGSRTFPPIVPVIHTAREPDSRNARYRKLLFPTAAHVVAVSRGVAETMSGVTGVPDEKISVIYNPTDAPAVVRQAEEAPNHPWFRDGGPPVLLGAGRLVPEKDFLLLIEAFRRVRAERACRLIILGEGPMRHELERRVCALGLRDYVSFPGWVENPYAFMARAALFVLSSRHEGLGNVLVEALACGCPAVSTDCAAGPAEILKDPALLAQVGNPEALARVMLRALARPAEKTVLRGKTARFSVERAVDEYESLVEQVLRARGTELTRSPGCTPEFREIEK